MNLIMTLQDVAVRLGLQPIPRRMANGHHKGLFLVVAGLASLALWTIVGWSVLRLVAWLGQL